MSEYPESDKLLSHYEEGALISRFIDWLLDEKDMCICEVPEKPDDDDDYKYVDIEYYRNYQPVSVNRYNDLLAEFFGIDMKLVEKERMEMLTKLRELHENS